jgi:hypothetical protein
MPRPSWTASCITGMTGMWYHAQLLLIEMRVSLTFCLNWLQTEIFLISVSHVTRITGLRHCLGDLSFSILRSSLVSSFQTVYFMGFITLSRGTSFLFFFKSHLTNLKVLLVHSVLGPRVLSVLQWVVQFYTVS